MRSFQWHSSFLLFSHFFLEIVGEEFLTSKIRFYAYFRPYNIGAELTFSNGSQLTVEKSSVGQISQARVSNPDDFRLGLVLPESASMDRTFSKCLRSAVKFAMDESSTQSASLVTAKDWKTLQKSGVRVMVGTKVPNHSFPKDLHFFAPYFSSTCCRTEASANYKLKALLRKARILDVQQLLVLTNDRTREDKLQELLTLEWHSSKLTLVEFDDANQTELATKLNESPTAGIFIFDESTFMTFLNWASEPENVWRVFLRPVFAMDIMPIERTILQNPKLTDTASRTIALSTATDFGPNFPHNLSLKRRFINSFNVTCGSNVHFAFAIYEATKNAMNYLEGYGKEMIICDHRRDHFVAIASFFNRSPESGVVEVLQRSPWFWDSIHSVSSEQQGINSTIPDQPFVTSRLVLRSWLQGLLGLDQFQSPAGMYKLMLKTTDPWTLESFTKEFDDVSAMPNFLVLPTTEVQAIQISSTSQFNQIMPSISIRILCAGLENSRRRDCYSEKEEFPDDSNESLSKIRAKRQTMETITNWAQNMIEQYMPPPKKADMSKRTKFRKHFKQWLDRERKRRGLPPPSERARNGTGFKDRSDVYANHYKYEIMNMRPGSWSKYIALAAPNLGSCFGCFMGCTNCVILRTNTDGDPLGCAGPCTGCTGGACAGVIAQVTGAYWRHNAGSVICTELYRQGLLDLDTLLIDDAFGEALRPKEIMIGYRSLAAPVVSAMRHGPPFIARSVRWLVNPWFHHMRHHQGYEKEPNRIGQIIMNVGSLVCYCVGRLRILLMVWLPL